MLLHVPRRLWRGPRRGRGPGEGASPSACTQHDARCMHVGIHTRVRGYPRAGTSVSDNSCGRDTPAGHEPSERWLRGIMWNSVAFSTWGM